MNKQIEILNKKVNFLCGPSEKDHLEALQQIAELGTPDNVADIIPHVFSKNNKIAQQAARVVRQLLMKGTSKGSLTNLYKGFSDTYKYLQLTDEHIEKLTSFPEEEAAHLLGIASLNYCGYIREAALHKITGFITPAIIPYILLGLNDWVPQIRIISQKILEAALPALLVANFLEYYELIEWLEQTGRSNFYYIQNDLLKRIFKPEDLALFYKALDTHSYKKRLFILRMSTQITTEGDILIDKAILDPAPEVRLWAARNLPNNSFLKGRLEKLLADPFIKVRYAALKAIPSEQWSSYQEWLEKAIFDSVKGIREYARFALQRIGQSSVIDKYRNQYNQDTKNASLGVILGIAEVGTQEDLPLLKSYINHPRACIRASVLYGLNRLSAQDIDEHYLSGLSDINTHVRKTCIAILTNEFIHLRPRIQVLLRTGELKTKKAALNILVKSGGLEALYNILIALNQPCDELRKTAWQHLATWGGIYSRSPWFSFNKDTYKAVCELLIQLKPLEGEIPDIAKSAWYDLPNILRILKEQ